MLPQRLWALCSTRSDSAGGEVTDLPLPRITRLVESEWLPLLLGYLALYIPSIWMHSRGLWQTEEQAHAPIILLVSIWLLWEKREAIIAQSGQQAATTGWLLLLFGLSLYVIGRSQDIVIFDVGSQIPVVFGALLIVRGWKAAKAVWFPVLFLVFMMPLPQPLVDMATGPLRRHVSELAEVMLYGAGYPIGRSGVVLSVGQYQLLVADACSGLNSMFSLSALGVLYIFLMRYTNPARILLILLLILPIAFAANIVRVIVLVLVTYHFGDEAGQGFAHGFAGMLLFVIALALIFVFDAAIGRYVSARKS